MIARNELSVFVPGRAMTKGSSRSFVNPKTGRSTITNSSGGKLGQWQGRVAETIRLSSKCPEQLWEGPVEVVTIFQVERPLAHFVANKRARGLRPTAPMLCPIGRDGDKLTRAVWDAMKGVVFRDDRQVAIWSGYKVYIAEGQGEGVWIYAASLIGRRVYWNENGKLVVSMAGAEENEE
jgi:Holliday junction resolvase RusA-like endonuclease